MSDAISIHNNLTSIIARDNIAKATADAQNAVAKLASGYAYTDPGEGIAESSIAVKMKSRVDLQDKALSIALQGNQLVDISHAAMTSLVDITSRQSALAVQAGSDNIGDAERVIMNEEFKALTEKVDIVAEQSSYNGVSLLTGKFSGDVRLNTKYETDYYQYSINNVSQYTTNGSFGESSVLEPASGFKVSDQMGLTRATGSILFAQNFNIGDRVKINGHDLVAVRDKNLGRVPKDGETFFELGQTLENSIKNLVQVLNASNEKSLGASIYELHSSNELYGIDGIKIIAKTEGGTGNSVAIGAELLSPDKVFNTSIAMEFFFEHGVADGEAVVIGGEDAYVFVKDASVSHTVPEHLSNYNVTFVEIDKVVFKTIDNLVSAINGSLSVMSSKYTANNIMLPSSATSGAKGYAAGFSMVLKDPASASALDEIRIVASQSQDVSAVPLPNEIVRESFIHIGYPSNSDTGLLDGVHYNIKSGLAPGTSVADISFVNLNQGAGTLGINDIPLKDVTGAPRKLPDILRDFLAKLKTKDPNIDAIKSSVLVANDGAIFLKIALNESVGNRYFLSATKGIRGTVIGESQVSNADLAKLGNDATSTVTIDLDFIPQISNPRTDPNLGEYSVLIKGGAATSDIFNSAGYGGSITFGGYKYAFAATAVPETATGVTLIPASGKKTIYEMLNEIKTYQDVKISKYPNMVIDKVIDVGGENTLVKFKLNQNKVAFDHTFDYEAFLQQPLSLEIHSDLSKVAEMPKVIIVEDSSTAASYSVGVSTGSATSSVHEVDSFSTIRPQDKFLPSKIITSAAGGIINLAVNSEAVIEENASNMQEGIAPAFSLKLDINAILAGAGTSITLGNTPIDIKSKLTGYTPSSAFSKLTDLENAINASVDGVGDKPFHATTKVNQDGSVILTIKYIKPALDSLSVEGVAVTLSAANLVGLSFSSDSTVDNAIKGVNPTNIRSLCDSIANAYQSSKVILQNDIGHGLYFQEYKEPVELTEKKVNVNNSGFVSQKDMSTLVDGLNFNILTQGVLSFQVSESAVGAMGNFISGDSIVLLGQKFMFLGTDGYAQGAVGTGNSLEDSLTNLAHSFNTVASTRNMGRISFTEVLDENGNSKALKTYQISIKSSDMISASDFNETKLEIGGWTGVKNTLSDVVLRSSIEGVLDVGLGAKNENTIERREIIKQPNFDVDLHGAVESFSITMVQGQQPGERNSLRFMVNINGQMYSTENINLSGAIFDKNGEIISGSGYENRGSFLAAGTELQFKHAFAQPGDVGLIAKLGKDIFIGTKGESLPEINKKLEVMSKEEQRDLFAGGVTIGINAEYTKITNVGVETIKDFRGMGEFSAESGLEGAITVMDYAGKDYAQAIIDFTGNDWGDSDYIDVNGTKVFVKADIGIGASEIATKRRIVEFLNKSRDKNIGQATYSFEEKYGVIVAKSKNLGSLGNVLYLGSNVKSQHLDVRLNNYPSNINHVNFGQQNRIASIGSGDNLSDLVIRGSNYPQAVLLPTHIIGKVESMDISLIEGYGISSADDAFVSNKLSIGAVINNNVFSGEIEFSGGNKSNGLINGSGYNGLGDFIAPGTKIVLHSTDQKSSVSFTVGHQGFSLDRVIKDNIMPATAVAEIARLISDGMSDVSIAQERVVASFSEKNASETILRGLTVKNVKYFADDFDSDGKSKVLKGFEFDEGQEGLVATINGSRYVAKLNAMNEDGRVLIDGARGVIVGGVGQRMIFRKENEDGSTNLNGDALIIDLRNVDLLDVSTAEHRNILAAAFNSAFEVSNGESLSFQINAGPNDHMKFNFPDMRSRNIYKDKNNKFAELDISTKAGAKKALEVLDRSIDFVQTERAKIGTMRSQFETVAEQLRLSIRALKSSISILIDADIPTVSNEHMMAMVRSNAAAVAFSHSLSSLRDTVQRILQS